MYGVRALNGVLDVSSTHHNREEEWGCTAVANK